VAYGYDELGRVVSRSIDAANPVGTTFDALGRVTHVTNPLTPTGTDFTYAYVDATSRLSSVTYPTGTGLSTNYSYYGNTSSDSNPADDDQRLETIQNMKSTTQLSRFDYTYNPVGTIATWTQQADSSTAVVNTLTYDNADQLTSAVQSGGGTASNAYHYDPAGNRLAEITGSGTTAGQFNNLNQLTAYGTASSQTVAGNTSAMISSATVNAVPATISGGTNFSATVPLPTGTNAVSVVAQPASGDITTKRYQIITTGTAATPLTYDANGNVHTDENGNTYTWDALNRLASITYPGGGSSTFAYDGVSRRIQIVDTSASGTATTKNYLWIGQEIAEERASNGTTVTKRFFPQGEQQSGTNYYYTRDHLGSVREMLNSSGTIVARYSYDPYGRTTLVSGSNLATFQYARMYAHQPSGLALTRYRAYDASTGRWLSRDSLKDAELSQGTDLYSYVVDNPICEIDPYGLCHCVPLPDSGPGSFNSNVIPHNFDHGAASSLTFHLHCPAAYPYLQSYGLSSGAPPPASTGHGHTFPGSFTDAASPTGSGPDYTLVVNVTSTQSVESWFETSPFINTIRVVGTCCDSPTGSPNRTDPPTTPPYPHRPGH